MQFLSALNDPAKTWRKEKPISANLPYRAQIDDRTILLRDGRLMQVIEVQGLAFETLDSQELNYRKALREATLQAIGSSRFAIYQHIVRRRVEPQLAATYPDPFSAEIDKRWRDRLKTRKLFSNELFLCLIRRPMQGKAGFALGLGGAFKKISRAERDAALAREQAALNAASEALVSSLSLYGARVLSSYSYEGTLCSEPLEFLSILLNGEALPVAVPEGDIGHHLPRRRISFGAESVELSADGDSARLFAGMLSIKEYPTGTSAGLLDDIMRLPYPRPVG